MEHKKAALLNLGCGSRYHSDWVNVDFTQTGPNVIVHDLRKGLPFDAETFDVVYHSHVLEHFSKSYARLFIADCFRVLKPGGVIRCVVPNLEVIARLYLHYLERAIAGDQQGQKRYEWMMLEMYDQTVRNQSGGEMLNYWKQHPMPEEDFVVQRMGAEVKQVLSSIRQHPGSTPCPPESSLPDPLSVGSFRLSGEVHQWMYDQYSLGQLLKEAGFTDTRVCQAAESCIKSFSSYLLDVEADGSVRKPDSLFMEAVKNSSLR